MEVHPNLQYMVKDHYHLMIEVIILNNQEVLLHQFHHRASTVVLHLQEMVSSIEDIHPNLIDQTNLQIGVVEECHFLLDMVPKTIENS